MANSLGHLAAASSAGFPDPSCPGCNGRFCIARQCRCAVLPGRTVYASLDDEDAADYDTRLSRLSHLHLAVLRFCDGE